MIHDNSEMSGHCSSILFQITKEETELKMSNTTDIKPVRHFVTCHACRKIGWNPNFMST